MMKYQTMNHNFIPKETTPTTKGADLERKEFASASTTIPVKDTLRGEPQEVLYLREQLSHAQMQINALEEKLFHAERTIAMLEGKLDQVTIMEKDALTKEPLAIQEIKAENEKLKGELKKNQEHIHTLYLILLVLAIL